MGKSQDLCLIMLNVYGDESMDGRRERIFAVAGIIGREEQWISLSSKWLERTIGKPFHATDCESNRGDYSKCTPEENISLYGDLTLLLARSGVLGYAFAVDLVSQRQVFPDILDFTYHKCLAEVIDRLTQIAVHKNEEIKFTFDTRKESNYNSGLVYAMMLEHEELAKWLNAEISFISHTEEPRIQAADLFAREARKAADLYFSQSGLPVSGYWQVLRKSGNFNVEAIGKEWFESTKAALPELQRQLNISPIEYQGWINRTNRQDNLSNRLLYMQEFQRMDKAGKLIRIPLSEEEALALLLKVKPTADMPKRKPQGKERSN